MDWGAIVIALFTGGGLVKIIEWLTKKDEIGSHDTDTAILVLTGRIDRLNLRVDKYEKQIQELEEGRLKTSEKLAEAKQELVEKDARIKALENENIRLEAHIRDITSQLHARDQEVARLGKQVVKLLARVDELEGKKQ